MSAMAISWIVFACLFAGGLLGTWLRTALPEHHLSEESKDMVRLGIGLIATMSALVLGLLIASAQSSYGTQQSEFTQMSTNIILLDRVLAHYGPETKEARGLLRSAVVRSVNQIWHEDRSQPRPLEPTAPKGEVEVLYDKLQDLTPQNDAQRSLQSQALSLAFNIGQTRWTMFEQRGRTIPTPFLVVLVCWLTIIFISFGVYAPLNATVVIVLFVCALSIAGAIFLILELDQPFAGWIQIPSTPLRNALAILGQ